MDEIQTRRQSTPKIILALLKITWMRKRWFLGYGIGRERPAITNRILSLLKTPPPSPHQLGIYSCPGSYIPTLFYEKKKNKKGMLWPLATNTNFRTHILTYAQKDMATF